MKSENRFKVIFLVGPPNSGKDTQGKLLAKKLKGNFCSTSDLIRDFFKKSKDNYLKLKNKLFNLNKEKDKLKRGFLVDSTLVTYIVIKKIEVALKGKKILIISGSPRRLPEAKDEYYFLRKHLANRFIFIFLKISLREILKRALKRGREDDTPEIIKTRIENYKKDTLPAIKFLEEKKVLIKIKGEGRVPKIHREILKKLNRVSNS